MSDRPELLAAALAHAVRGWHVFPLWPGSKTPAVPDAWQDRATRDPDLIGRWWRTRPYNIGIAVGPSGLFVIDLDHPGKGHGRGSDTADTSDTSQVRAGLVSDTRPTQADTKIHPGHGAAEFAGLCAEHGQPIPADTYTVATVNHGWQLYYQHPAGPPLRNTKGGTGRALGEHVDTRGHGGYVVAAGSVIGGRRYRAVRQVAPMPLPGWLATRLVELDATAARPAPARPVAVRLAGTDRRAAYRRAALAREVAHVRDAPKDRGNAVLWGAAVALGQLVAGGDLPEALVADVLEQAATADGRRSVAEARATIRSGLRRGAQRPRTVA
jgi:hypothetical protein